MASHAPEVVPNRFRFERGLLDLGFKRIAGVDEAGRGPLAGPVTAAAVILPRRWIETGMPKSLWGLNDSKQLRPAERERYFAELTTCAEITCRIQSIEAMVIDESNILRATHEAMRRAIATLEAPPDYVLVDGRPAALPGVPQNAIVKGDSLSYSIAAASVLAKVARDRAMLEYDRQYPGYGFAVHKGYPTPEHLEALRRLGPCPIHRRSFAPLKSAQLDLFAHATLVSHQELP